MTAEDLAHVHELALSLVRDRGIETPARMLETVQRIYNLRVYGNPCEADGQTFIDMAKRIADDVLAHWPRISDA